ncbi:MAG TPA: RNA polymerase factor sigma-54 [Sporosarcina psychrophila]|uniref:RNA polymerase factor sigma-54 n=1 Tax=Sporosarcina psychrophila TaxID=1476 RepID=A0A921G4E9_SPOPS|nr:RNA polymerase factor sigma-54 [Sporosarcina psychrophila]
MQLVIEQRQGLHLTMTPDLRQAIEILQYSTYELYQYLQEKELENPLIELESDEYKQKSDTYSTPSKSTLLPVDFLESNEGGMKIDLMQQVTFTFKDEQDRKLLKYLIYNLDDNGYLYLDEEKTYNLQEIERGIHLLQKVGPTGIGARNLIECLQLQIIYEYPEEILAECLILNHLDLLANHKWNEIAFRMNLSLVEVKEIHEFIKTLNPKPCSHISDFKTEYLTPDIVVDFKDEEISYHLNDGYLPKIQLNKEYTNLLKEKSTTSKYLNSQFNDYQQLLNSIEQRRTTILKIMKVIIKRQEQFFKDGFASLQPLTLKEVAEEIGMHESTISRATSNKVIQTPKGTFYFKTLFTSKLETSDGKAISQTKVKALLEKFIAEENKSKPLSDQTIANYFNSTEGIIISRRTISKYREELSIPTSRMRKK